MEAVQNKDTAAAEKLPPKDTVEYWVIRSQTLTEFIPLLTKKRTEFKKISKLMARFLVKTGKSQAFLDSKIEAPQNPELYIKVIGIADRVKEAEIELPPRTDT